MQQKLIPIFIIEDCRKHWYVSPLDCKQYETPSRYRNLIKATIGNLQDGLILKRVEDAVETKDKRTKA